MPKIVSDLGVAFTLLPITCEEIPFLVKLQASTLVLVKLQDMVEFVFSHVTSF